MWNKTKPVKLDRTAREEDTYSFLNILTVVLVFNGIKNCCSRVEELLPFLVLMSSFSGLRVWSGAVDAGNGSLPCLCLRALAFEQTSLADNLEVSVGVWLLGRMSRSRMVSGIDQIVTFGDL